jgi:hypothetical protein
VVLLLAAIVTWRWWYEAPAAVPLPTTQPQATVAAVVPRPTRLQAPPPSQEEGADVARESALQAAQATISGPLAVTLSTAAFVIPEGWHGMAGDPARAWAGVAGPRLSGAAVVPGDLLVLWPAGQSYAGAERRLLVHVAPAEGLSAHQAVQAVTAALARRSPAASETTLLTGLLPNGLPIPALAWQMAPHGFGGQAALPWRDGEELLFVTTFAPDRAGVLQLLQETLASLVETNKLAVADTAP